jgi:hypothetical protein
VVGAGNLSYTFARFLTVGAGITSLPSTRSTEGQFLFGMDDGETYERLFDPARARVRAREKANVKPGAAR